LRLSLDSFGEGKTAQSLLKYIECPAVV